MNRLAGILALVAVLVLSSCSSLRRLRNRPAVVDTTLTISVIPDSSVNEASGIPPVAGSDSPVVMGPFLDTAAAPETGTPELADDSKMVMPFWMVPLSYSTFSGKAKAHIESPEESRDFTLTVRIESGKKIWMSVVGSALGISMEAFRAVLTPDSMIAINRIDREVIRAPFSEIAALFPVQGDFYALEAVLVGSKLPVVNNQLHASVDPVTDAVVVSGSSDSTTQSLMFSRADSTMIRQQIVQPRSVTDLSYADYVPSGARRFAQSRQIVLKSEGTAQTLSLDYTSFAFDESVEMPLTIPEKYKQR